MAVKYRKQTDEFPFTATHILLDQQAVLHHRPETNVLANSGIEAGHFEGEITELDLRVKGKRGELALGNTREDLFDGDDPALTNFGDDVLGVE